MEPIRNPPAGYLMSGTAVELSGGAVAARGIIVKEKGGILTRAHWAGYSSIDPFIR